MSRLKELLHGNTSTENSELSVILDYWRYACYLTSGVMQIFYLNRESTAWKIQVELRRFERRPFVGKLETSTFYLYFSGSWIRTIRSLRLSIWCNLRSGLIEPDTQVKSGAFVSTYAGTDSSSDQYEHEIRFGVLFQI